MKQTAKSLIPYYKKIDISKWEKYRVYEFPNGEEVKIDSPEFLIVSDNGHRVGCAGASHYIPYGWIHLWWVNADDRKEHFFCESSSEEQAKRAEGES